MPSSELDWNVNDIKIAAHYDLFSWKGTFSVRILWKKNFRFKNFLFVKSIYTTFECEKVSCAKLIFKNVDFTTFLVVAVLAKKWKIQHFGIKQIRLVQLLIRKQKKFYQG